MLSTETNAAVPRSAPTSLLLGRRQGLGAALPRSLSTRPKGSQIAGNMTLDGVRWFVIVALRRDALPASCRDDRRVRIEN